MIKVITYGTYDLLHYGHIRLLKRAKALGDYLIVGITSDDFDKARGKINVSQSLMERIEAVRATGLADEIIVEEYEGQKIDDIKRLNVDIFTVGSDWKGKFDYLNEFCKVVYLERTEGVSSSDIRTEISNIRIGFIGNVAFMNKFIHESGYVNGVEAVCVYTDKPDVIDAKYQNKIGVVNSYHELLKKVDAVYIASHPSQHYNHIMQALRKGVNVLCEAPVAITGDECIKLLEYAESRNLVLMESNKTAYAMAYNRLLLLIKSGKIGDIVSIDATCTSLVDYTVNLNDLSQSWSSILEWGPVALLPIFQILGTEFKDIKIASKMSENFKSYDIFTKIDLLYNNAVASIKVGKGIKSESELIITGTKGYIYVPAPWWKTEYFEIRYENIADTKKYFYQLEGEGIRYELLAFANSIKTKKPMNYIENKITVAIANIIERFNKKESYEFFIL